MQGSKTGICRRQKFVLMLTDKICFSWHVKEEPKISNVVAGYRPAIGGEDHQFQTSAKPYLIQTAVSIYLNYHFKYIIS